MHLRGIGFDALHQENFNLILIMDKLMFYLYFHYEDVSCQDPFKSNYANVMEVFGSCKIIIVPKITPFIIMIIL